MAIQHSSIADADRHEAKGASSAVDGQVLQANGDGTTSFVDPVVVGWYNYNNTLPAVALTAANTYYDLTNNAAGTETFNYASLPGVTSVWDTNTNRFNWTGLEIGTLVDIRLDLFITTTQVNTAVDLIYEIGIGGTLITVPITSQRDFKTVGTVQITLPLSSFIGSANVRDNPARLRARADKTGASIQVKGWFIKLQEIGRGI